MLGRLLESIGSMGNQVFGGMPGYIRNIRKPKAQPSGMTIEEGPLAEMPDAKQRLVSGFDELMATPEMKAATPQREGLLMKGARGLSQFLGFVPQDGVKNDAVTGIANIARGLFQEPSIQEAQADYNQRMAPERLRKAIESGDIREIAKYDPTQAAQLARMRTAETDEEMERKQDLSRAAMAIQRETGMSYGDAARFVNERMGGNVFTDEDLAIADKGGYAGLASAFGREDPYRDRYMPYGGQGVIDLLQSSYNDTRNLDLRFQDQLDKQLQEIENLRRRGELTEAQAYAARMNAEANIMRAQASQRGAEAQIMRAEKYQPMGGAAVGGFSDPVVIASNMESLEDAIDRGRKARLLQPRTSELNEFERSVSAAMSTPTGMDNPATNAAYALLFPERYRAFRDINASVLPLVNSLRTLPGMTLSRLADTEKEFERLMQSIVDPFSSYEQVESSLANVRRLLNVESSASAAATSEDEYVEGDVVEADGVRYVLRNNEWVPQ